MWLTKDNNDDDKNNEPETLNQQIWRCQEVASKRLFYEKDFEKLFPLSHEDGLADDDADVMLVHISFPNFNVDKAADLRGSLQFGLRSWPHKLLLRCSNRNAAMFSSHPRVAQQLGDTVSESRRNDPGRVRRPRRIGIRRRVHSENKSLRISSEPSEAGSRPLSHSPDPVVGLQRPLRLEGAQHPNVQQRVLRSGRHGGWRGRLHGPQWPQKTEFYPQ